MASNLIKEDTRTLNWSLDAAPTGRYRSLFRRFFIILILAAILPLASVGIGAYLVFNEIHFSKSVREFQNLAESHSAMIEIFLAERLKAMQLASSSYDVQQLTNKEELAQLFKRLNSIFSGSFQDLGIIDQTGRHLAYIGDYDLLEKNYTEEPWFKQVSEKGSYISDVFLGFRNTPHFIIGVMQQMKDGFWILRASIDSDIFSNLVSKGAQGKSGDCFLIDENGRYQTYPRHQAGLLEDSGIDPGEPFTGVHRMFAISTSGEPLLRIVKWVSEPHWLLVVQQEETEFMASVKHATIRGMAVFLLGVLVILAATYFTTQYLLHIVEATATEKEHISQQFMQASKLAAIGELATGLAHEINNPLAIILSEQTNISDLLGESEIDEAHGKELSESVGLVKKQVLRCRTITQKMLKFGRQGNSQPERIRPEKNMEEIVQLLEKQAAVNNIALRMEIENGLPEIFIDSSEYEQVATNLITNALQAVRSEGAVLVSAFQDQGKVHFTVEDTGPGILQEHLDHIFSPFFTTKPVGKGTGLGLAVCYGIVIKWKGQIWVESKPGSGAIFHFTFPTAEKFESAAITEGV